MFYGSQLAHTISFLLSAFRCFGVSVLVEFIFRIMCSARNYSITSLQTFSIHLHYRVARFILYGFGLFGSFCWTLEIDVQFPVAYFRWRPSHLRSNAHNSQQKHEIISQEVDGNRGFLHKYAKNVCAPEPIMF